MERLCLIINDENNNKIVNNYKLAELLLNRPLRKISQKQFEQQQKNKKIKGEKAETFVMIFEISKLESLDLQPYQASIDNINLGYDIESYDLSGNKIYIEVKSLNSNNNIFWTENEINKSKILKDAYYIYCVEFKNGEPYRICKKIKNPYDEIIKNKYYKFHAETKTVHVVGIL